MYEEHVWRVYAFCAYRLGDRESAEDLTQLTFEQALRAWSRYDFRRAAVSTWLLRIARNALIDQHRRGRGVILEELDERVLPALAGPEQRFAGSPELIEALARLDDRERDVLALRFGADLRGPEIAQLLGISVANVQQISSRAIRRLRELLEHSGGEVRARRSAGRDGREPAADELEADAT